MTTTATMPYWVIIAWVTMDGIEPTGRTVRRDGYDRPEFREAPLAKACTWVYGDSVTPERLATAKAYAEKNGASVFTYEEGEHHPLRRARAAVLKAHKP